MTGVQRYGWGHGQRLQHISYLVSCLPAQFSGLLWGQKLGPIDLSPFGLAQYAAHSRLSVNVHRLRDDYNHISSHLSSSMMPISLHFFHKFPDDTSAQPTSQTQINTS